MKNIMELAPLPWRVDEHGGRIEDAKGQPIAWIAARLNIGDDSRRVIANKLVAAANGPRRRLTPEQAARIRAAPYGGVRALAREFGISSVAAWKVRQRITYGDLP